MSKHVLVLETYLNMITLIVFRTDRNYLQDYEHATNEDIYSVWPDRNVL